MPYCITLHVLNHWKRGNYLYYLYYFKPLEEQIQPYLYLLLCKQLQYMLDWIAQESVVIHFWELIISMSCLSSRTKSVAELELQAELLLPGKPRPDQPGGGRLWSVKDLFAFTNIWILEARNKLVFIKTLWAGYSTFSCLFPRKCLWWLEAGSWPWPSCWVGMTLLNFTRPNACTAELCTSQHL